MPWIKLDTDFAHHPKLLGLADPTHRYLWVVALAWSGGQRTDGVIPAVALPWLALLAGVPDVDQAVRELVDNRLWCDVSRDDHEHARDARNTVLVDANRELSTACFDARDARSGAWLIHDYAEYQRTRSEITALHQATRERAQRWRDASRAASRDAFVTRRGDAAVTPPEDRRDTDKTSGASRQKASSEPRADIHRESDQVRAVAQALARRRWQLAVDAGSIGVPTPAVRRRWLAAATEDILKSGEADVLASASPTAKPRAIAQQTRGVGTTAIRAVWCRCETAHTTAQAEQCPHVN